MSSAEMARRHRLFRSHSGERPVGEDVGEAWSIAYHSVKIRNASMRPLRGASPEFAAQPVIKTEIFARLSDALRVRIAAGRF
jgi:hypothetical protein